MAAMLRSAALFNRHMNAHFLSLIPKFRSGIKERKQKAMCDIERKTQKQLTNAQSATTKPFSLLGSSAVNCSSTTKRHPPVSTDSALGDIRLPNLEKKDLSPMSKGNSDDASLKVLYTTCVFFTRSFFHCFQIVTSIHLTLHHYIFTV